MTNRAASVVAVCSTCCARKTKAVCRMAIKRAQNGAATRANSTAVAAPAQAMKRRRQMNRDWWVARMCIPLFHQIGRFHSGVEQLLQRRRDVAVGGHHAVEIGRSASLQLRPDIVLEGRDM